MQREKNYGAQKLTVNFIEHTWECCSKGGEYFFQHLTSTLQGKKGSSKSCWFACCWWKKNGKKRIQTMLWGRITFDYFVPVFYFFIVPYFYDHTFYWLTVLQVLKFHKLKGRSIAIKTFNPILKYLKIDFRCFTMAWLKNKTFFSFLILSTLTAEQFFLDWIEPY